MMRKTFFIVLCTAVITGLVTAYAVTVLRKDNTKQVIMPQSETKAPVSFAAFSTNGEPVDFSTAAEKSVHSVVHVKTTYQVEENTEPESIYDFFYGNRGRNMPMRGSGSGVIISPDGYIVTNNHVVDKATEVKVTFNDKRTMTAKVIGSDKNSDIALLKVEAKDLPALAFGNSDELRLGEWVLAVGNPLNLTSTVTAGIVSAKGRNINIIDSDFRIESFIQTDAAINRGNSGGALVNLRGELIGINTAIASNTGTYEGYGFAVPSSIVKKTVEDLIKFGTVQRAILGIGYREVDEEIAKEFGIADIKGVYINRVEDNSAAKEAGIQVGDVILAIDGKEISSGAIVQEEIGKKRPGDKINLTIDREGKTKQITAVLRNKAGNMDPNDINIDVITRLGASLKDVTPDVRRKLGISGGVQVEKLTDGKLKENGVKEGFVIMQVNQRPVRSVDDLKQILKNIEKGDGIYIAGVYPNKREVTYYAFGM